MKDTFEKRHLKEPSSGEMDEFAVSKRTFISHNRKTVNELEHEKVMG